MYKGLIKHIFNRSIIIVINQLAVLISLPIIAARLDFLIFGYVAIGFLIIQLSWVISNWGIQNYSIEIWRKLGNKLRKSQFISCAITLNLLVALFVLFLFLFLITVHVLDFPLTYWLCIIPSVLMGGMYPNWFFQVQKTPEAIIIPTFFSRLIYLVIIIFMVRDNKSAYWAFIAQGINITFITIYTFFYIYVKYSFNWHKFKFKAVRDLGKSSFPFLINSITNNQINTIWGFGLSLISGPYAMGLFSLGDQIYRSGGAITNIIAQSVRIYFIKKSWSSLRITILFFVVIYILIATLSALSVPIIIQKFFSTEYLPAIQIIQTMLIAWALHAIVKLLNYPVLGGKYGSAWVNIVTYKIIFIHIFMFAIWYYLYTSPLSMAILFTMVIMIQLFIFYRHIYVTIRAG